MAETPLFTEDSETVANLVGLKTLRGGGSSHANFQEAIRETKVTLWMQLSLAKIVEIQGTAYTATPSTDAEFVRLVARQVELDIIRWHLMDVMQLGFKGGEAEFIETWNTDGKFKRLSTGQLNDVRARLWSSIATRIQVLKGDIAGGDSSNARGFTVGSDEAGFDRVILHRWSPYTGDALQEILKQ